MLIQKTIISVIELIPNAIGDILHELSRTVSLSEKDTLDLNLILEESTTNAIHHGNQFDTGLTVQLSLELDQDMVTIRVKDEGRGFDYRNLPDLKESNEKMNPSGRGIFLIKRIADEVSFNEAGSEICVRKRIHPLKK